VPLWQEELWLRLVRHGVPVSWVTGFTWVFSLLTTGAVVFTWVKLRQSNKSFQKVMAVNASLMKTNEQLTEANELLQNAARKLIAEMN